MIQGDSMQQYFIEQNATLDGIVVFDKEQSHHIQRVLRMKENDIVKVVDCDGSAFLAEIYYDGNVYGKCIKALESRKEKPEITLVQGMIKKDKWDFLIQKVCEVGVNHIIPMISSRTIVKVSKEDKNKIERYNKIALEACEQCKRETLVDVSTPIAFKDIIKYKKELNIIAYEDADFKASSLKNVLRENKDVESILYVIGSEGGFSKEEVAYLCENGFTCVSLGERILRAETAAISIVNATRYEFD